MRPFLIPDPDTEWIIRRLFKLYLDGTRSTTVAQTFNDEKVPNSSEKPWTGQDVTRRLKIIAYAGFIRHGKRSTLDEAELLVPWPEMELVSLEDYNQAQEIMASHAPKRNHPREVASVHLLSGRVFCGICEYKMSPTGGDRSYYNCNHRRRHLSSCDTPNPPADLLDAAVLQHILNKVVTKENTERVLAIVAKSQTETMTEVEDELRNVSLEIENLKGARRTLMLVVEDKENDFRAADISDRVTEIRDDLTRLEANALEARAKVSNEKALIANPEKVAAYVKDLGTYLRGTNLDLTKQILRELIVEVRVFPGETRDTATLIIKYRIPTPPKGWSNEADVEELMLRRNARSLELPVHLGDAPLLFLPGLEGVFLSCSRTVSWDSDGTTPNSTTLSASSRRVQWSWPSGASLHARAIRWASPRSSSLPYRLAWGWSWSTPSNPSSAYRRLVRNTVRCDVSRAAATWGGAPPFVSLAQDARPIDDPSGMPPTVDQSLQLLPVFRRQPYRIFLRNHGCLTSRNTVC